MRKRFISLLACLFVLTAYANDRTVVSGEYWIDSGYDNRTKVSISNDEMDFTVDASALSEGVHRLCLRVLDSDGNYSPTLSWAFYRLATTPAASSNALEYWVDSGTHQTVAVSDTTVSFVFDGSSLTEGLHKLSYRLKGSNGYDSPIQSWLFYRDRLATDFATKVQEYEYWTDGNYSNRTTGTVQGDEVEFSLNAATLGEGVHTLHYRVKDDKGNYSPTQSWAFFRTAAIQEAGTTNVEYWIDEGAHQTKEIADNDSIEFAIDASALAEGVHTLYYRLLSSNGSKSPMQAWKFYCTKQEAGAVAVNWYRTWWNDRQDLAQTVAIHPDSAVYVLDEHFAVPVYASNFCNTPGDKAKFNILFGNDSGLTTEKDSMVVTRTGVEFYAVGDNYTPVANGELQATPSVKVTYGDDTGWKHSETNKLGILTHSVAGSQQPTDAEDTSYNIENRHLPQQGCYYMFTPTVSGALRAGITIEANKAFYVVNGNTGEPITEYDLQDTTGKIAELRGGNDGSFSTLANQLTGICTVNVDAGTPYYIFANNAQLRFFGFEFYKGPVDINPATTAAIRDSIQKAQSITPIITLSADSSTISISCRDENGIIYYTTDGTNPVVADNLRYKEPIIVDRNYTIKAISLVDGVTSPLSVFVVDWFKVATPTFSIDGITLTINCTTPEATIYYNIGKDEAPSASSTLYKGPFVLNDNQPVKAIAIREGYKDSEVARFEKNVVTSQGVTFAYNGRYLSITPIEKNATVYYTLNGDDPTVDSEVYTEKLTIDKLLTVKAAAKRPYTNLSPVESIEVTYLYDGHDALVKNTGQLAKALEWCGADAVKELHINGPVNATDYQTIRQLPNLLTLNMEKAQLEEQMLPDNALQGCNMRWFVAPNDLSHIGKQVFADCKHLAAITWNAKVELTAEAFGTKHNPNMLYYVPSENVVRIDNSNVISNGRARSIVLYDGAEFSDFYCPKDFYTVDISYTRNFRQKTQKGICQGWETIALPFNVQTITHWKNGELVPFASYQQDKVKRLFWLAKLDVNGFVITDAIEANTPYLIAMPNDSAAYADRNIQAGEVTFSARNIQITVTDTETNCGRMGDVVFVPNYELRDASQDIYAINLYETYGTHQEGSIFLPNYRQLRPFEAYTGSSATNAPPFIAITELEGESTGIYDILTGGDTMADGKVKVYNLSGTLVKTGNNQNEIMKSLPKGVYIINGKKTIIK